MDAFGVDEDDHDSENSPESSFDDERANDRFGGEVIETLGDNDEVPDEENEEDEEDRDESQDSLDGQNRAQKISGVSRTRFLVADSVRTSSQGPADIAPTSVPDLAMPLPSSTPTKEQSPLNDAFRLPSVRPEALTAPIYDIVPTIAAPQSTSINALCATPDLRWVFTGGTDNYIRKYNWVETANGKAMLTVAQRHPFVESVTKAGVLSSYWENEDEAGKASDDANSLSPVYSLAVQREALWLLSGTESGAINIQSVRHDEGKRIATLKEHTSAISVLNLAADEQSALSGGWDKKILLWDLHTGQMVRKFEGGSQISTIEFRPESSLPVPEASGEAIVPSSTFFSDSDAKPKPNGDVVDHVEPQNSSDLFGDINGDRVPNDDLDSLFGDNEVPSAELNVDFGAESSDLSRAIVSDMNEQDQSLPEKVTQDLGDDPIVNPLNFPNANDDPLNGENVNQSLQNTNLDSTIESPNNGGEPHISDQMDYEIPQANAQTSTIESTMVDVPGIDTTAPSSNSTFLAAAIDGSLRIWDKRKPTPIAIIVPQSPPWCMNASFSIDGNAIYAGRRNGTVDEYSMHKSLRSPQRVFKLPSNSGPVSAIRAMPNGRHLICASYDILRLYDLHEQRIFKNATVPWVIVPGHRTGVISHLYIDPTCRYLISTGGNRGWEGSSTEALLGYEVGVTGTL